MQAGIENIGAKIENPIALFPMLAYCTVMHNMTVVIGEPWVNAERVRPAGCASCSAPQLAQAMPFLSLYRFTCAQHYGNELCAGTYRVVLKLCCAELVARLSLTPRACRFQCSGTLA